MTTSHRFTGLNQPTRFTIAEASRRGFGNYQKLYRTVKNAKFLVIKENVIVYLEMCTLARMYGDPDNGQNRLVGVADIAKRWGISPQAVHKRLKSDSSFPRPISKINNNTTYVFAESDIKTYESKSTIGATVSDSDRRYQRKWFANQLYEHGFEGRRTGILYYRDAAKSLRQDIKARANKKPSM